MSTKQRELDRLQVCLTSAIQSRDKSAIQHIRKLMSQYQLCQRINKRTSK